MQAGSSSTVYRTEITGVPLVARGKVRDIYDLGDSLLFVATLYDGLRVVDASIMPDCIRANTNVTTMVIGERIADFIRQGL